MFTRLESDENAAPDWPLEPSQSQGANGGGSDSFDLMASQLTEEEMRGEVAKTNEVQPEFDDDDDDEDDVLGDDGDSFNLMASQLTDEQLQGPSSSAAVAMAAAAAESSWISSDNSSFVFSEEDGDDQETPTKRQRRGNGNSSALTMSPMARKFERKLNF